MRLALITSQAFSLGNFRGSLICDLVRKGATVYALAPDYDDATRQIVRSLGAFPLDIKLSRTGFNPVRDLASIFNLIAVLNQIQPDITLGYFVKPVIYGTLAAWISRIPRRMAMIEGLGYVFTRSVEREPLRRKILRKFVSGLYRFSLSKANTVIFLNPDDVKAFLDARIVSEDKVAILGGIGVDLAEWKVTPQVSQPVTFVLIARLLREKGIVEYSRAARIVKARFPEVKFVLLGGMDSNPGALTHADVSEWVEQGLLEWYGHVDVKPWLASASVFVLPSYREGVPRSTQEAMAMGRAVITTDVPGCRETVIDSVNGYLVPVRDSSALANAMLRFIESPDLITSMGLESRRLAEERFDVAKINARFMNILGVR